jgi:ribose transport system substrate-binding protein
MKRSNCGRLIVLFLLLGVFIFGTAQSLVAAPKRKIGIISLYLAAAVPPRIAKEAEKLCEQEGWQPIIIDTKSDNQRLISTCLTWVQQKVDAIFVLFPSVGLLEGEVIPACNRAGIPVVTVSGWTKGVTFDIAPNEYIASALETTYMIDRLGHEGNIVTMEWHTDPCPRKRQSVLMAILENEPRINLVNEHEIKMPGHIEDCQKAMESILLSTPKSGPNKIDAVWGAWDELALGALQAIEAAGRDDIFVVGIDGNLWTFDQIRKPNSRFAATVAIQWEDAAHIFVDNVKKIFAGRSVPENQFYIPAYLVTRENCPPKGKFYNPEGKY